MTDNVKYVYLSQGKWAIVDADDYLMLKQYAWYAVKKKRSWYAVTTIHGCHGDFNLYMHRLVAHTPANMVTHHKKGNSLDNRKAELQNMLRRDHKLEHINNPIKVITTQGRPGPSQI